MLVLVHPSFSDARKLARALARFGSAKAEDGMVVLQTKSAQEIAKMFGVARVSAVVECENQLGAISKSIAEVGRKTVLPGQSFYVKVHMQKKRGFTSRDVEFAATGALAAEFAGASKPAANEQEAQKTIAAYVGRRAFVAVKEYEGAGGAIAGSHGNAGCALTGRQSFAACMAAAKAGFSLELLLVYSNEDDLRKNARLARTLVESTGAKKQGLAIAKLQAGTGALPLDLAAIGAFARMKSRYVVLPVSLATHPKWFIEAVMGEVHDAGKVPLVPLMFSGPEESWQDARKEVRRMRATLAKPKRVRLEVGPDYLHDILDSV